MRAFWFDDRGQLLRVYYLGNEIRRSEFQDFSGVPIARRIEVLPNGGLGMWIQVTDIASTGPLPDGTFEVGGHDWTRAFTDEAR